MPDPVLLVLDADPSPRLGRLTGRVDVRYADAGTLAERLPAADVLLVWDFASDAVRDAWPGPGRRPRWVHTASAGVDRLLCPELVASDTVLTNARGIFERPIAEYVAGLVLAMAKDLPGTLALQRERRWHHREGQRVAGSRAVVVGAGPSAGRSPGCCTASGSPWPWWERTARRTIHGAADLDRLAARADWVIAAAPLTEATRGMFDSRFFGLLSRRRASSTWGAGERGQADLVDALHRRWFAAAAARCVRGRTAGPGQPVVGRTGAAGLSASERGHGGVARPAGRAVRGAVRTLGAGRAVAQRGRQGTRLRPSPTSTRPTSPPNPTAPPAPTSPTSPTGSTGERRGPDDERLDGLLAAASSASCSACSWAVETSRVRR